MKRIINNIEENSLTIDTAFDNFMLFKRSEGLTDSTLRTYKGTFKDFRTFCDNNEFTFVTDIDKALMEKYKNHLLDLDVKPETRNTYLRTVKVFVTYLIDNEEIAPIKIKLFNSPAKETVSTFTDEELKKMLDSPYKKSKIFSQRRDYAIMQTFLLTGVRRSTLADMRISDVNFADDKLILRHIKRDNAFDIKEIPLNPDLKVALRKYIKITNIAKYSDYLFPNIEGNKLNPDTISKRMYKFCEAVDINPRACHEYRRTFATKTYKVLEDTEKTRKLMVISDPRVLRRYINEDMDMLQESSQQLNFVTQIQSPRPLRGKINKGA